MQFKIKHIGNLLIRLFTRDKYYICEECHHMHKRNGKELRLDDDKEHLISHPLWYGSVKHECFVKQQMKVKQLLRDAILGK